MWNEREDRVATDETEKGGSGQKEGRVGRALGGCLSFPGWGARKLALNHDMFFFFFLS